jgi:hypothetical protein
MESRIRIVSICLAAALIAAATAANDSQLAFVPWKVLNPGAKPLSGPLLLYWIPRSEEDFKHSPLLSSRPLTMFASQCVVMQVIRCDDAQTIAGLRATDELPVAILMNLDRTELARVRGDHGVLPVSAVETMVRDAMRTRESEVEEQLDECARRLERGEKEGAVALYRRIWEQRCMFPRAGREAQRALKRLGIAVAQGD